MKTAEPFSYKPPMTAVRSGIKYENGEAIFIGKDNHKETVPERELNSNSDKSSSLGGCHAEGYRLSVMLLVTLLQGY
jgi:hypothetical protein